MQGLRWTGRRYAVVGSVLWIGILASGGAAAQTPGEVSGLTWCSGTTSCLEWSATPLADGYRLYRGTGDALADLGTVEPDSCTVGEFLTTDTGLSALPTPAPGRLDWYLVTAYGVGGEGTAGDARTVDSPGPCALQPRVVLNEIDYDQPGTDSAEFVEILNPGSVDVDLAGLVLILVNGVDGSEYERFALDQAGGTLSAGGYLVVGSSTVLATLPPGTPAIAFAGATNNLQNGAPEGLALFDTASGILVDALSYEGSIVNATFDGVPGFFDLVEGDPASVSDSNVADGSMARVPDGQDTDDADADWSFTAAPSPGAPN